MPDVDPDKSTTTSLKRLRESDESAPAATQPVRGNESSGVGKERRRHPRYNNAGGTRVWENKVCYERLRPSLQV